MSSSTSRILNSLWISSTSLAISPTGSTLKRGKMDSAASMIEKDIIANPTYVEAYNNLGVLYRDAGDITQAINAYEQCLKIDPDSRNAARFQCNK